MNRPAAAPPWNMLIHAGSILLSAFLLFAVQPLITRLLLPVFGGAPAVWNTALVFFQVLLLLGYAYAHWAVRQPPRRRLLLHALVLFLPFVALPPRLIEMASGRAAEAPVTFTLAALAAAVGLPFLALSTNSSLVQHAYSRRAAGRDPYWLYAASNGGSAAALLLYPLVLEPLTGLSWQLRAWTAGYLIFAVLGLVLLLRDRGQPGSTDAPPVAGDPALAAPDRATKAGWVVRSALATSLLLGTTMQITTDVASIPLLWTGALLTYLVTFMLAFGLKRPPSRWLLVLATSVGLSLSMIVVVVRLRDQLWALIGLGLFTLFCGAWLCHTDLAAQRPAPRYLTGFYLWITLGGALGGLLNSLVAPLVFDSIAEYPITLAALAWLIAFSWPDGGRTGRRSPGKWGAWLTAGLIVAGMVWSAGGVAAYEQVWLRQLILLMPLIVLLLGALAWLIWRRPWVLALSMSLVALHVMSGRHFVHRLALQERSFFGVLRVLETAQGQRVLLHGTTVHGSEWLRGAHAGMPGMYYHPRTVLGQLAGAVAPGGRLGIVGLGTGALASQLKPDQTVSYFEIDPLVVRIAQEHFSFLRRSRGQVDVRVGDGRLLLRDGAAEPPYDLLIVDAFSSDAIPTHLLTREAFKIYLRRLSPEGILAFHISNEFFDLEPVIATLAADAGLAGAQVAWSPDERAQEEGAAGVWAVVLARDPSLIQSWAQGPEGRPLVAPGSGPLWTDDHVNLLSTLRR